MYEYAKGKGMTVIAMPITPAKRWFDEKCSSGGGGDHSVSYTNELNNWILSKPVNVDYVIDIYSLLNDGSGYLDASKGYDGPPFNDGLHPSYVAHEAIANKLYDEIFSTWTTTPTPTPTSTPVVTTPAPAATSGSCIIFYGDTQTTSSYHSNVVDAIEDEGCSYYYLFHAGDIVSAGSSSSLWTSFLNIEKDLIDKGKFYPVVGNHELYTESSTSHYGVTEILNGIGSSFTYLDSMFSQNDYKGWYTEQITDNIAFIGLNNGLIFKYPSTFYDDECKEQNTFLTNALDANKGKKIIIAYHAPAFPRLTRYSSDSCAKNEWHEIIKNYASYSDIVVISGHTHGLAHGEKDGITYLEVGASNSGLAPDCRSTSSAGVDSSQGCKNTNGYYRCDSSLTTCSAKDTSRNTLYTVTI